MQGDWFMKSFKTGFVLLEVICVFLGAKHPQDTVHMTVLGYPLIFFVFCAHAVRRWVVQIQQGPAWVAQPATPIEYIYDIAFGVFKSVWQFFAHLGIIEDKNVYATAGICVNSFDKSNAYCHRGINSLPILQIFSKTLMYCMIPKTLLWWSCTCPLDVSLRPDAAYQVVTWSTYRVV